MTKWERFEFEGRVSEILRSVQYYKKDHHFGRPFLTAYQNAIEFANRYPEDFRQISLKIGGRRSGERTSLAQYIAGELSRRILSGELKDTEGGFISNRHLKTITFDHDGKTVESSLTGGAYDLSMFRLRK